MSKLPLLPLKNVAVFPELIHALIVGRPASLAAVKAAVEDDREVLTVLQKDPNDETPSREGLYDIGTVATVTRIEQREGGAQVIVRGLRRVRLKAMSPANDGDDDSTAYVEAEVEDLPPPGASRGQRGPRQGVGLDSRQPGNRAAHRPHGVAPDTQNARSDLPADGRDHRRSP